jgi:hypothetical protein
MKSIFQLGEFAFLSAVNNGFRNYRVRDNLPHEVSNEENRLVINNLVKSK